MKKLLYSLGLLGLGALAIAPQSQACPAPALISAVPEDLSMIQAFAIPERLPQPQQPCSVSLTAESRALLQEALAQAERLEEPADKAEAVLALSWSYKRFEIPSARLLLQYGEQLTHDIADPARKLVLLQQFAEAHDCFEQPLAVSSSEAITARPITARPITAIQSSLEKSLESSLESSLEAGPLISEEGRRLRDEARELSLNLGARTPVTDRAIANLAHWYANTQQGSQAKKLAASIRDREIREDIEMSLEAVSEAVSETLIAHGALDHEEESKDERAMIQEQWGQVQQFYAQTTVLESALLNGQHLREVDFERALTKLAAIDSSKDRYLHGLSIARIMVQSQLYDAALNFLADHQIPASASHVEEHFGMDFSRFMPSQIAGEMASRGYPTEAIALIEHMPEGADKIINLAVTHAAVSNAYLAEQQLRQAEQQMARAGIYAAQLVDSPEKGWVLMTIGAGKLAQGDRSAAERWLAEAIALDPTLEAFTQSFEDSAEMLATDEVTEKEVLTEKVWALLGAETLPDAAQLRAVEGLLERLPDRYERVDVLSHLAAAWDRNGEPELSLKYLSQAVALVQTESEFDEYRTDLLESVFYDFSALGGTWTVQQQGLAQIGDEALRQRLMLTGLEHQLHRTYGETVAETTTMLEHLAQTVQQLPPSSERQAMMLRLAVLWSEQDGMERARRMVDDLEGGDRVIALAKLAESVAVSQA